VKLKIVLLVASVFTIAQSFSQTVKLKQIGKDNLLLQFSFAEYLNGNFYTITNNTLYKTDLNTGEQTKVGNTSFQKTQFFFALKNKLYSLENDGSLTQVEPATGAWSSVSGIGSWLRLNKIIVVKNSMYAIENGSLYYYPVLNPQLRKQIGGSDFYDVGILMRTDTTLHSLIRDGSVYEINLTTGEWKKIGKGRLWKYAKAGAVLNNKLYTVESPSSLFETNLADGERKELDKEQFKKFKLLFSDMGKLYGISNDGTLYEISFN
jgi:hypothetical protein